MVVDVKRPLYARIAETLAATAARPKGRVTFRKGYIMAGSTKIVVARVYPKPGRLQEVIDVYASIVPLVHQEPAAKLTPAVGVT